MGLFEECQNFRDRTGLIVPCDLSGAPASETGNNLYTWLLFIQLVKRGECRPEHLREFKDLVDALWVRPSFISPNYVYYGLMHRAAYKKEEQEGPDDYVVLALASKLLNTSERTEILSYGARGWLYFTRWVYNNLTPESWNTSSWFGRQGQVIAHFHYACDFSPGVFLSLWWLLAVLFSGRQDKGGTTPRILTWCMIQAHTNKNFPSQLVCDSWYNRLKRDFPGGMQEVVEKHLGKMHPIAKYWVD